jgi:hypothetical protein
MLSFKEQGYLVLPGVLDPALVSEARDYMWRVLSAEVPWMQRDDPATWRVFDGAEILPLQPSGFSCYNARQFHIRCGAEELFLDLFPRAMWAVVEQLLGAGTVAWPGGAMADGLTRGPCFQDQVSERRQVGPEVGPTSAVYSYSPA